MMLDFKVLHLCIYDDPIDLEPETVQRLRNAIHMYLTYTFETLHESFPRPDEMFLFERQLLKIECDLERYLYSRGYKVVEEDAEQKVSRV